ncbi:Membrane-associated zinc metalloprotease [Candidatus Rhodobacter oscarellae]|uniref:Zinc metalloprotease n=1 Tax=Candidatus Rhodobacter oscarellae TaxID=1675527 RepID=A0A0J9E3L7_9RHOB|nr:RIP metalloprotease RseP [Candidatus Rhodobacter lobularis]KMW57297.1 Membrane-associated zinc metalloprotease [Candidatus Rhodobacter lobularis]
MELINLLPNFGNLFFTVAAFIIALSVIVAIHEYGHYIVGRWCGIKADVFSLGFGPVIFSRPDKHGTVWQIAALPLGGFVKFRGDANAASAGDDGSIAELTPEERRATMHGAPLWARSLTVAAGPVFNFILSTIVFGAFLYVQGTTSDPLTIKEVKTLPGIEQTLEPGDEILQIAGTDVPTIDNMSGFLEALPRDSALLEYTVLRDGREVTLQAPHPYTTIVSALTPGASAMAAGVALDDVIVAVDDAPIRHFYDLLTTVETSEGRTMKVSVVRGSDEIDFQLTPRVIDLPNAEGGFTSDYKIGVGAQLLFSADTETPGFGEAIWFGLDQTWYIMKVSVSALYNIATFQIDRCNMRGLVGIAQTSGEAASQGLDTFIRFIAVLSAAVGLLNLFPIPVLDGGHLVFFAYEAVRGKPPGDRVMQVLMVGGLMIVLSLMLFGLTNDFTCP